MTRPAAHRGARSLRRVPVRSDLAGVEPYGAPQEETAVRLNTNEPPYPPPAAFDERLRERLASAQLHRYPDRDVTELRERLGARAARPVGQVWAAAGSNEVLMHLISAYGGPRRRLLLFTPGYSAHPLIARAAATPVVTAELDEDFSLAAETAAAAVHAHDPDVVVVASPNAPTGVAVPDTAITALHDAGRALVVLDAAYVEFADHDHAGLLDRLPRLVMVRTVSKAWRLAGARLGYAYAPEWVVSDLMRVRLPYHLDALAQAAGLAALDCADAMTAHVAELCAERERLMVDLARMGARVWSSQGNFVLFDAGVDGLFARLRARGVLVRDFSSTPRLGRALRVTVGTPAENDAFLTALRAELATTL